ncbi:MAG: hypothetical protein AAF567_13455 [Actinomycetota bacterium]
MSDVGRRFLVGSVTLLALFGGLLVGAALWFGAFGPDGELLTFDAEVWVPVLIFGVLLLTPAIVSAILANRVHGARVARPRRPARPTDTTQAAPRDPTVEFDCPRCRVPDALVCRFDDRETAWCSCRRCGVLLKREVGVPGYVEVAPRQWERGIARSG